jgi:uncharacterized protein (DUF1778 family)
MSSATDTKDERINLRLKRDAKLKLERAASLEGQTVSKFILHSALALAEKTIHEHEVMNLNIRESEAFYDALSKPVKFNEKLIDALEEHSKRVTSK